MFYLQPTEEMYLAFAGSPYPGYWEGETYYESVDILLSNKDCIGLFEISFGKSCEEVDFNNFIRFEDRPFAALWIRKNDPESLPYTAYGFGGDGVAVSEETYRLILEDNLIPVLEIANEDSDMVYRFA